MAGVIFDKGYRSDLMVYISGVLPGARYALCQHMWHISAQVNTSPICHSPVSVYNFFTTALLSFKLPYNYLFSIHISYM